MRKDSSHFREHQSPRDPACSGGKPREKGSAATSSFHPLSPGELRNSRCFPGCVRAREGCTAGRAGQAALHLAGMGGQDLAGEPAIGVPGAVTSKGLRAETSACTSRSWADLTPSRGAAGGPGPPRVADLPHRALQSPSFRDLVGVHRSPLLAPLGGHRSCCRARVRGGCTVWPWQVLW